MARFVVGTYYVIPWNYPSELIGYFLSPRQVHHNDIYNFFATDVSARRAVIAAAITATHFCDLNSLRTSPSLRRHKRCRTI